MFIYYLTQPVLIETSFVGGTLKIYGESIRQDLPYKTLLLSTLDNASYVVKETLDKYGMEKEDPTDYCLIQVGVEGRLGEEDKQSL